MQKTTRYTCVGARNRANARERKSKYNLITFCGLSTKQNKIKKNDVFVAVVKIWKNPKFTRANTCAV